MTGYTYSFLDVTCGIAGPGGAFPIAGDQTGSADEGITITFADDAGSIKVGADGTWMTTLNANRAGMCSITLLKNSPINALLAAKYNVSRASGANYGQDTIVITQLASGDIFELEGCSFKKFPDVSYGKEGPALKWDFNVGRIDPLLGAAI
jgi:hypothetical protein